MRQFFQNYKKMCFGGLEEVLIFDTNWKKKENVYQIFVWGMYLFMYLYLLSICYKISIFFSIEDIILDEKMFLFIWDLQFDSFKSYGIVVLIYRVNVS